MTPLQKLLKNVGDLGKINCCPINGPIRSHCLQPIGSPPNRSYLGRNVKLNQIEASSLQEEEEEAAVSFTGGRY